MTHECAAWRYVDTVVGLVGGSFGFVCFWLPVLVKLHILAQIRLSVLPISMV